VQDIIPALGIMITLTTIMAMDIIRMDIIITDMDIMVTIVSLGNVMSGANTMREENIMGLAVNTMAEASIRSAVKAKQSPYDGLIPV